MKMLFFIEKCICKICGLLIKGRADKVFCFFICKNVYYVGLCKVIFEVV